MIPDPRGRLARPRFRARHLPRMSSVLAAPAAARGPRPASGRPARRPPDSRWLRRPRRRRPTTRSPTRRCRTGTACWPTVPHTTIDASELRVGLAARADGQLRGRAPQHRRRPRRLPGFHADRPRDRDRRVRRAIRCSPPPSTPRATAAARAARAGARCRRAACTATSGRSPRWSSSRPRAARARIVRARLSRRPRHAAAAARRASLAFMDARLRELSGARIASICRPLLRDGPRPALGARRAARTTLLVDGSAPYVAASAAAALAAAYARGETDEFVQGRPRSSTRRQAPHDGRRRRRRVHELPRRPRAADDARADRSRVRRLSAGARAAARARSCASRRYGDEFARPAGGVRAADDRATASASTSRSSGSRSSGSPRPRNTRTSPISSTAACEAVYPGRGPHPGARRRESPPTTCKPEMSAPEVTDKLVAAIASRQVRRDRLQLRERRHGRPHRQLRRAPSARRRRSTRCIGRVVARRA